MLVQGCSFVWENGLIIITPVNIQMFSASLHDHEAFSSAWMKLAILSSASMKPTTIPSAWIELRLSNFELQEKSSKEALGLLAYYTRNSLLSSTYCGPDTTYIPWGTCWGNACILQNLKSKNVDKTIAAKEARNQHINYLVQFDLAVRFSLSNC